MTDRSKIQRKKRLQLNAEEFAPPPNLYDTSEEPRLDDAWVKFYGGETKGRIKRLSELDLDEELAAADEEEDLAADTIEATLPRLRDDAAAETETSAETEAGTESYVSQSATAAAPLLDAPAPAAPQFPVESRPAAEPPADAPRLASLPAVREFPRESAPPAVENLRTEPPAPAEIRQKRPYKQRKPYRTHRLRSPRPLDADFRTPSFEDWSQRWAPWMKRGGVMKVCQAFFNLTYAKGSAECFTTNSVIMNMTGLSRAQCIRNVHYLIELGFLKVLREVNNKEAKGTFYRFNLTPTHLNTTEN